MLVWNTKIRKRVNASQGHIGALCSARETFYIDLTIIHQLSYSPPMTFMLILLTCCPQGNVINLQYCSVARGCVESSVMFAQTRWIVVKTTVFNMLKRKSSVSWHEIMIHRGHRKCVHVQSIEFWNVIWYFEISSGIWTELSKRTS